jgi:alpha-tubulin suppressor-like RCC1 family protein
VSKMGKCEVIEQPTVLAMPENAVIAHVACGNAHSIAVDDKGNLFSWGRGFEGQTGLSSSTKSSDENKTLYGVQMVPKFVYNPVFIQVLLHLVLCLVLISSPCGP